MSTPASLPEQTTPVRYRYTAGARSRALRLIPLGLALGVLGGLCVLFLWWTVILAIVGGIIALVGAVFLFGGLMRLTAGGEWQITIDDTGIEWRAPLIAESSFCYRFNEIDHLYKRTKEKLRSDGSTRFRARYALVARNGRRHDLSGQSGVNTDRVAEILSQQGVRIVERVAAREVAN